MWNIASDAPGSGQKSGWHVPCSKHRKLALGTGQVALASVSVLQGVPSIFTPKLCAPVRGVRVQQGLSSAICAKL